MFSQCLHVYFSTSAGNAVLSVLSIFISPYIDAQSVNTAVCQCELIVEYMFIKKLVSYNPSQNHQRHSVKTFLCVSFYYHTGIIYSSRPPLFLPPPQKKCCSITIALIVFSKFAIIVSNSSMCCMHEDYKFEVQ